MGTGEIFTPTTSYADLTKPTATFVNSATGVGWTGVVVSPGAGTDMPKAQFQSTEALVVSFPPFVDSTTGLYIIGTDTCTLTYKKPDNTVATVAMSWDTDVQQWSYSFAVGSYATGLWRFMATSSNANALKQYKSEYWGDYVETIATINTKIGTPVVTVSTDIANMQASLASDIGNVNSNVTNTDTDVLAINTLIGVPANGTVSADIAAVDTNVTNTDTDVLAINTLIGVPANGTVSADIAEVEAHVSGLPIPPSPIHWTIVNSDGSISYG